MTGVLTIAAAHAAMAAGRLSAVELVQECLARVRTLDGRLHSVVHLMAEDALAEARASDAARRTGRPRGALDGIPIGLKDIFDCAGVPTTAQSRRLLGNVAREDAACVGRLRDAGALVLGKLATHEFALGGPSFDLPFPPARNPWDTARFTGGSSSGSGAAVAAGLVMGATGSDTGGSIRVPAAYCGIAGLKPTYGLVSRHGVLPLAWSLDHAGPMAWTVEDCAMLLTAMAGPDHRDPASAGRQAKDYRAGLDRDLSGLRVGVVRHFHERDNPGSPAMAAAVDAAGRVLADRGATVGDVTLSPLHRYVACGHVIMLTEGFSVHGEDLASRPAIFGEAFRERMSMGALFTSADYLQALRTRRALCAEMAACFAGHDILVTAAAPAEAPAIDSVGKFASYERPALSLPFNVTGNPALVIPCGTGPAGLPLGVQFAARPFEDDLLLAVGHGCERELGDRGRRPALAAGRHDKDAGRS